MTVRLDQKIALCINAVVDKQASNIVLLDLKGISTITDSFLICSGSSIRQVQAIADAVDEKMSGQGVEPEGVEGYSQARWILMDYGDLVVHIFHEETRSFYEIERLWAKAPALEISAVG